MFSQHRCREANIDIWAIFSLGQRLRSVLLSLILCTVNWSEKFRGPLIWAPTSIHVRASDSDDWLTDNVMISKTSSFTHGYKSESASKWRWMPSVVSAREGPDNKYIGSASAGGAMIYILTNALHCHVGCKRQQNTIQVGQMVSPHSECTGG